MLVGRLTVPPDDSDNNKPPELVFQHQEQMRVSVGLSALAKPLKPPLASTVVFVVSANPRATYQHTVFAFALVGVGLIGCHHRKKAPVGFHDQLSLSIGYREVRHCLLLSQHKLTVSQGWYDVDYSQVTLIHHAPLVFERPGQRHDQH